MANYVEGIHLNHESALVFQKRECTSVWGTPGKTWEGGVLEMDFWKWMWFLQV